MSPGDYFSRREWLMNRTVSASGLGVDTVEADISVDALSFSQEAVLGAACLNRTDFREFAADTFGLKERDKSGLSTHLLRIIS